MIPSTIIPLLDPGWPCLLYRGILSIEWTSFTLAKNDESTQIKLKEWKLKIQLLSQGSRVCFFIKNPFQNLIILILYFHFYMKEHYYPTIRKQEQILKEKMKWKVLYQHNYNVLMIWSTKLKDSPFCTTLYYSRDMV